MGAADAMPDGVGGHVRVERNEARLVSLEAWEMHGPPKYPKQCTVSKSEG